MEKGVADTPCRTDPRASGCSSSPLVLAIYVAVVLGGLTESTRRSLLLRDETDAADRVFISIVVTNASPLTQELTAQLAWIIHDFAGEKRKGALKD
jgi:hypothetical protein